MEIILLENEEFVDVKGYEGLYQVSNKGRIISTYFNKKKLLTPKPNHYGYLTTVLAKDKHTKTVSVHRLVAETFMMDSWFEGAEIDHINNNKNDNSVENLRWVTRWANMHNMPNPRARKVRNKETGEIFDSAKLASQSLGLCDVAVGCSIRFKCRAGGYYWEYADGKPPVKYNQPKKKDYKYEKKNTEYWDSITKHK